MKIKRSWKCENVVLLEFTHLTVRFESSSLRNANQRDVVTIRRVVVICFGLVSFGGVFVLDFSEFSTSVVRERGNGTIHWKLLFHLRCQKHACTWNNNNEKGTRHKLLNYAALPRHSDASTNETHAKRMWVCVCTEVVIVVLYTNVHNKCWWVSSPPTQLDSHVWYIIASTGVWKLIRCFKCVFRFDEQEKKQTSYIKFAHPLRSLCLQSGYGGW